MANNAYLIAGIGEAITCGDRVFCFDGDRHHWEDGVQEEWEDQWWFGAPYQVITVKEKLVFQNKLYSNVEMAEYILAYCINKKGWIPKIFFDEEEAKRAKQFKEYACPVEKLKEFHAMLMYFTEKVKDHHYLEIVFGAIDEGPTMDMALVEATRKREVFEEAGCITQAELIGFSDPYTGRKTGLTTVSALYKSHMKIEDMEALWAKAEAERNPTRFEWGCAVPWYSYIPGIDKRKAMVEKALHETCNGKWYPLAVHPRMDKKNKAAISKYI